MAVITIIGAGMMGSAMSFPAASVGNDIRIVGTPLDRDIIIHAKATGEHLTIKRRLPDGIAYFDIGELDEALSGVDLVICGVSSFGIDWFIDYIIPRLPDGITVLSITKGMLHLGHGSLISYPEMMEKRAVELGKRICFCAVGGPCTSYELADKDFSSVTFCGRNIESLRKIKSMFETDYYHISLSTDIRGVECAVALKNAYALGVTLAVGLSFAREGKEIQHYNSQAAVFGQSIREIQKLLRISGALTDNIFLAASDLYVTIFGGRTRLIGTLLGKGLSFNEAMEALPGVTLESIVISGRTAEAVRALIDDGKESADSFPLLMHIDDIISNGARVNIPWGKFETETII